MIHYWLLLNEVNRLDENKLAVQKMSHLLLWYQFSTIHYNVSIWIPIKMNKKLNFQELLELLFEFSTI